MQLLFFYCGIKKANHTNVSLSRFSLITGIVFSFQSSICLSGNFLQQHVLYISCTEYSVFNIFTDQECKLIQTVSNIWVKIFQWIIVIILKQIPKTSKHNQQPSYYWTTRCHIQVPALMHPVTITFDLWHNWWLIMPFPCKIWPIHRATPNKTEYND